MNSDDLIHNAIVKENFVRMMKTKQYLGDGLYVHFDGYHIMLSAPREEGEHYVALEPHVYKALTEYKEWLDQQTEILNDSLK